MNNFNNNSNGYGQTGNRMPLNAGMPSNNNFVPNQFGESNNYAGFNRVDRPSNSFANAKMSMLFLKLLLVLFKNRSLQL